MNVEVELKGDYLKIYVDSILHLYLNKPLVGFQAWNKEDRWWEIEIYTKYSSILLQYDSKDKWETILKAFDKCLN